MFCLLYDPIRIVLEEGSLFKKKMKTHHIRKIDHHISIVNHRVKHLEVYKVQRRMGIMKIRFFNARPNQFQQISKAN